MSTTPRTQPPSDGGEGPEVNVVLLCKVDNARSISNILSAIHNHHSASKKDQMATCTVSSNGLKFTVEESKSLQGNAFLQEEIFDEYRYDPKDEQMQYKFKINLSILMDCLGIFGGTTSSSSFGSVGYTALQMIYSGYGGSLIMMLEEGGVVTDCAIKTMEASEVLDFNFRSVPITNKVIMIAEILLDAFHELDWSVTGSVLILLSPDPPYFRLTSTSRSSGTSLQVEYPKGIEVFESFDCSEFQERSYKLNLLQPCVKALSLAQKTQLRMNQRGVLSIQHMIKTEDKSTSFVDFFLLPEELRADGEKDEEMV